MNRNIFKLVILEIENTFKYPLVRFLSLLAIAYLCIWLKLHENSFAMDKFSYQYFLVIKFVVIVASVYIVGREFKNGAYKYTFSGCLSRKSILITKLMATIGVATIFWIFEIIFSLITVLITGTKVNFDYEFLISIVNTFTIYVIIAALISGFSMLVSTIFLRIDITMISGLILFGLLQFYAPIFLIPIEKASVTPWWFEIVKVLPTYIIFDWNESQYIKITQLVIMLLYVMLCVISSIFILNKKDLSGIEGK